LPYQLQGVDLLDAFFTYHYIAVDICQVTYHNCDSH
jgi:hypothetical protein